MQVSDSGNVRPKYSPIEQPDFTRVRRDLAQANIFYLNMETSKLSRRIDGKPRKVEG